MGIMDEVRQLVRQGKSSREIIQLGYAPGTVYKIQRHEKERREQGVDSIQVKSNPAFNATGQEGLFEGQMNVFYDDDGSILIGIHFTPAKLCPACRTVVNHWSMCSDCDRLIPQGCECNEHDASLTEDLTMDDLFRMN